MDAAPQLLSVDEYLTLERTSEVKHEFVGGIVYAMAGGSYTHNLIASNFLVALGPRLRGTPCKALNSDTRIRVRSAHHVRFYYPDASVICGSSGETYQEEPRVLVEVLSPSTRRVDETEKRDAYLTVPGLQAYLLVEQDGPEVVVFRRTEQGFAREVYRGLDAVIPLPAIQAELPLAELYEAVDFPSMGEGG